METISKYIRRAPLTILIIAVNIAMMMILSWLKMHEVAAPYMRLGAMYTPNVLMRGEYYRLFTSMFLHFDFEHIFGNMLLLFFLGEILEPRFGRVKYLVIYLLGGVFGNLLSMLMDLRLVPSEMPISAGASGAVFALIGAMAYLLIINRGRLAGVTIQRLVLLIVLSVWDGLTSKNIDLAAHIGGLIAGFLLTLILYRQKAVEKRYVDEGIKGDKDEDNMYSGGQS